MRLLYAYCYIHSRGGPATMGGGAPLLLRGRGPGDDHRARAATPPEAVLAAPEAEPGYPSHRRHRPPPGPPPLPARGGGRPQLHGGARGSYILLILFNSFQYRGGGARSWGVRRWKAVTGERGSKKNISPVLISPAIVLDVCGQGPVP
eukprot:1195114-Prorocentrum_minimum.AAC.1